MLVMSLPAQQKANTKRTGKRITFFNDQGVAMKEASQRTERSYYDMGAPPSESGHNEAVAVESSAADAPHMFLNSVIFSPEKGNQNRGHYQQTMAMKWPHQELSQKPQQRPTAWPQNVTTTTYAQNYVPYLGGHSAFVKQVSDGIAVSQQQPAAIRLVEKQQQAPNTGGEAFRDATKAGSGLDWEQPQQAFQQGHKSALFNPQQNVASTTGSTSVLQPFQLAFGQPRQNLAAGYYQAFPGNRTLQNVNFVNSTQTNSQNLIQQHLQQQQKQQLQQQQIQRLMFHKPQFQHHTQQLVHQQQQQQMLQHQQQSQQLAQSQSTQPQQQAHHLNQMQQQSTQIPKQIPIHQQAQPLQQQLQQHLQKSHQQQVQSLNQQKNEQIQKLQQNQQVVEYSSATTQPSLSQPEQPTGQTQDTPESTQPQENAPQCPPVLPQASSETRQPAPRRSRRLSKEGGGQATENPILMPAEQQSQGSHNGGTETSEAAAKQAVRAALTGVIQSTRRKRRVSQEANLETLAQKASEMESLPSHSVKVRLARQYTFLL